MRVDTNQVADMLCNPADRRFRFPSYGWLFRLCQLIKCTAGQKSWSGVRPHGSSDKCLIGFSHNTSGYKRLFVTYYNICNIQKVVKAAASFD